MLMVVIQAIDAAHDHVLQQTVSSLLWWRSRIVGVVGVVIVVVDDMHVEGILRVDLGV